MSKNELRSSGKHRRCAFANGASELYFCFMGKNQHERRTENISGCGIGIELKQQCPRTDERNPEAE